MQTVFEGTNFPGVKRQTLSGTGTGVSPLAVTLPAISAYGLYLAVVTGWFGNNGDRGYAYYLVTYYKAATSSAALSSQQIGSTVLTPGQQLTALSLAAPNSSGVMVATMTSTRGSSQGNVQVELFEISGAQAQYAL